ncbi:hypothetical protein E8E12_002483 [Didymella heteroderae]|uniref:Carrier domain-containing protein n=1 Tax=Didymella heteroderae TaxID=1769908 RepID=A0A9P5C1B0_9PLEO|nr:hypothetical protein E8E12_002483 [Didymella heteroderae]
MLIGDETTPTSACADKISEILQPCTGLVIRARSISSLTDAEIRFDINNSVIVLQDHDKPLFDNFDESALAGLKKLFATSRNVLWVTHGYKRNETHARMFVAFARCLVQEMGHVRLQILDFESPDALDAELISRDFLRLLATAGWEEQGRMDEILWSVEPEIAYEEGYAFVPRVKPSKALNDRYNSAHRTIIHDVVSDKGTTAQIRVQPVDHGQLFQCDKAYWLVGLTGDLGLSLCQWMITKGARHIALSSRHPKVDPAWLTHFRSLGATVKVLTCDVTELESVETALSSIEASMPPIAGVCHGAMVLQDALFHDLDMPRVEQVLKPKVDGAVNLDKAFRNRSLDFFILLSSIAAITGNAGQSIYAAANGFLAGLGAQRRARGESATTINLGPILGAGAMRTLTAAQQKKLEKDGVMWTSEQDFHTAFAEAVAADRCCPDSNGEFTTGVRMYFLTTKLLKALQMPSDSSIIDKTADALGIDSLIAIEIRSWLLKELGVDLPLLIIIGGNNMRQVLEVCRTRLDPGMLPLLQASKSQTTTHEVQYSHEESRVEVSHDQKPPVTSANASPTAFSGAPEADTAERHDAEVTGTIVSPTYVPLTSVQQHGSNELPAAANAEPDAESVPISDRVFTEQKAQRVKSGDGPDALSRADSSGSSLDDIETGRSAQLIDMKGGTVHVRSVHGGSPEGSTQSQGLTKRKGLLGRVLRSRRFARLRGYV